MCCEYLETIVHVANAMFFSLKLLICEPYYLCLSRLECLRPRLEPSQAIGTHRALPRSPSIRLGCHANLYIYYCFAGLTFSPLGTVFPLLLYILYFIVVVPLFLYKLNYL